MMLTKELVRGFGLGFYDTVQFLRFQGLWNMETTSSWDGDGGEDNMGVYRGPGGATMGEAGPLPVWEEQESFEKEAWVIKFKGQWK
jgi:hypothetical protein